MTLHVSMGCLALLSALMVLFIRQQKPSLLVAGVSLISIALWSILDGIWQPTHAFSILEPSLISLLLVGMVSSYTIGNRATTILTLLSFLTVGLSLIPIAQILLPPSQQQDVLSTISEAILSGSPIILAAFTGIWLYSLGTSPQRQWPQALSLGVALFVALAADSMLYTALSQGTQLWSGNHWVLPLLQKFTIKILSITILIPFVSWGWNAIENPSNETQQSG